MKKKPARHSSKRAATVPTSQPPQAADPAADILAHFNRMPDGPAKVHIKKALRAWADQENAERIHTGFTLQERDRIDDAHGRALRLVGLLNKLVDAQDVLDDSLADGGMLDILDVIREDLSTITALLLTADARRETGGAA